MDISRKPYASDVSDEEWALVAPYLALLPEDAGQRGHSLREVFNGLRYVIRSGCPWRMVPSDLPPILASTRRRCISRRSAGWRRAASPTSPATCARCCGWRQDAKRSPRPRCWTAAH